MATTSVDDLYERHIKALSPADRLRLLARMAQDLAEQPPETAEPKRRSIMELHGLGAEIWREIDAQDYVNALREEWDHRP